MFSKRALVNAYWGEYIQQFVRLSCLPPSRATDGLCGAAILDERAE